MNNELITNASRPSATFSYRAGPGAGTNPGDGGGAGSNTGTGGNVLAGNPPEKELPLMDAIWILLLLMVTYWTIKHLVPHRRRRTFSLSNRQKPSSLGLCYCEKTTNDNERLSRLKLLNASLKLQVNL